jgi:hypothetical protein
VLIAFVFHFFFNVSEWNEVFAIMTISFLFGLPIMVGVVSIYLSKMERIHSKAYRFFFPWVPVFVFFVLTLIIGSEGWACWIMVLPLFLLLAGLGGLIGGYIRLRKSKKLDRLNLSLVVILPFLCSPIEQAIGLVHAVYEAHTWVDIEAPVEVIWENVTRVREIAEHEDTGKLNQRLGIPRPVRAELDFEGVNAHRKAIFTGGLVFDETVTEYRHHEYMRFSITPNTGEIPSTTFDEHILIGGEFFDVLTGTYQVEKLGENQYRLKLWSEFEVNTTFNFYSGLWAKWIMQDIQNNILTVIKARSEEKS